MSLMLSLHQINVTVDFYSADVTSIMTVRSVFKGALSSQGQFCSCQQATVCSDVKKKLQTECIFAF